MDPINVTETTFHERLLGILSRTKYYSDAVLLKHTFNVIPFDEMKVKATIKLSMAEEEGLDVNFEDFLLFELLSWFKNSFFTWFDAPKCNPCNVMMKSKGDVSPTQEEATWDVGRVELYECSRCHQDFRFPRYNNPRKLLQTRTGRCGEWANCFTLVCLALDYEARFVYDFNDHVWCEVFSRTKNKWVHCDPCEEAYDSPLMYELGWKKTITHVIAISPTEVQDVTWRYTTKFDEVLARRRDCREEFLLAWIQSFQQQLAKDLDDGEKHELKLRQVRELCEFLTPPKPSEDSYQGRSSGSLAWRLARGEIPPEQSGYTFTLTREEISSKRFSIRYSCARDIYLRDVSEIPEWSSCAFSHENIFRKVERDWNMVYLCRTEGSSVGIVTWKFEFGKSDLIIDSLTLNLDCKTYENGVVRWVVSPNCDKTSPIIYSSNHARNLQTQALEGCTSFLLSAELTEGTGSHAWQHSQLFRQPVDCTTCPFKMEIIFKKKDS